MLPSICLHGKKRYQIPIRPPDLNMTSEAAGRMGFSLKHLKNVKRTLQGTSNSSTVPNSKKKILMRVPVFRSPPSQTSPDGNVTLSIINYVPSVRDAGKYMSCRAENAEIPDSSMEDGWKLEIHCEFKRQKKLEFFVLHLIPPSNTFLPPARNRKEKGKDVRDHGPHFFISAQSPPPLPLLSSLLAPLRRTARRGAEWNPSPLSFSA